MVLKNKRTQAILDTIEMFGCANAEHIQKLYFAKNKFADIDTQKKLTALVNEGTLKRKRSDIDLRYIYYFKEPKQTKHKLACISLYVALCQEYGIDNVTVKTEYTEIEGIRPDMFVQIKKDKVYMRFIEIHLSNNELNCDKYLAAAKKNHFGNDIFPDIYIYTNRKVNISTEANKKLNIFVKNIY